MPTASITSTKTGQTFDVDFTNQPTADDIDEVTSAWETQFYQREGLDPSIAEQGAVGTAANAFARDIGGTALDAAGGVAKGAAEMTRALGPAGNALRFVPGVSAVMSLGDAGDTVAGFTDAVREESRAVFPTNPANPVAETIGGGAGQAVAMLGTMGAAAPVVGTGAALTVVPSVLGGTMGLGGGIDTAKDLGIDNPAGRLALGAAFGGAEALTERLGGIGGKAAAEALQQGVKAGLKQAGKSVLSEAIEEPISGTLQDAATFTAGQFVEDPNRPGYTVTGMKLPALDAEFLKRRKLEAIGGAAGGAVFAGLQLAASGRDSETGRAGDLERGPPPPLPVSEDLGELTAEEVADLELEEIGQPVPDAPTRRQSILTNVPDRAPVGVGQTVSAPTRQQVPGFQDDPLNAPTPAAGGNVLRDFGIAKSPQAQAIAEAAEMERQKQVAGMQVRNGSRAMPRIPDSPLGALDILDYLNETPLKVARKDSKEAGNAENDWSERFNVPMYYRKFIASSERGYEPSTVAQTFYEQGLINEPTVDALMAEVESTINARTQYRVQFRQRDKALKQEAQQVSSFEKDQAKAGDRDKTLVALDDVVPGDEMMINGEKAVVRKIDYDEDGYLTNVVIEDGKRYGVLSLDPTTRAGVFVDEYQPRQREQAAPDFEDPFTMQSVSEEELAAEKARAKQRAELAARQNAALKGDAGEYGTPDMLDSTAGDMALFNQPAGATSPNARVPAADATPGLAGVQPDGEGVSAQETPRQTLTFDEYAAQRGVSRTAPSFPESHRAAGGVSKTTVKAKASQISKALSEWQQKRGALKKEYDAAVQRGEINIPSRLSKLEETAQGDGEAAAAAKRLLAKRGFKNLEPGGKTAGFVNGQILAEAEALIREGFTDFANWSRAMVTRFGQAIRQYLQGIWEQVVAALPNDAAKQVRMGAKSKGGPVGLSQKGFFAGFNAVLPVFMRDSLESAKTMAAEGKDSETIRAVTGWFPGKYDGKLRWEIPDDGAKLKPAIDSLQYGEHPPGKIVAVDYYQDNGQWHVTLSPQNAQRIADLIQLKAVNSAVVRAMVPDAVWKQMQRQEGEESLGGKDLEISTKLIRADFPFDGFNALPLEDVLNHPALFAAYPDAKDIMVRVDPKIGRGGSYSVMDTGEKVITVGNAEKLSTLLHEIQHWIQEKETFAKGANVEQMGARRARAKALDNMLIEREREILGMSAMEADNVAMKTGGMAALEEVQSKLDSDTEWNDIRQELNRFKRTGFLSSEEQYRRAAGEIESRDVQARQAMTVEQRAAIAPYSSENIAKEDAIVMMQVNGPQMSMPSQTKETKSRFARPDEQERLYQVREDVTVKAAAEAWVDSLPMAEAVAAMEAGRLPADMTGDVAQHAAGLLIQRTTEMMKSGSEVVQMQARSLGHRISKVWQGWLSQEAGRNLRQRSVVNSELSPYAPILAAEGMLIDRADAVMDKRFEGGAEGGAEKLNDTADKAGGEASKELGQDLEADTPALGESEAAREMREARKARAMQKHPNLKRMLNALRKKLYPGMKWSDIFMDLPSTQKERQREIYRRLMLDERLKDLTKEERLALTNELDKAWQQERRKVFLRELGRVGIGEKAAADKAKVVKALPKLIRLINLGMMNSDMFREAIAPEYGLKQITTGQALTLRKLAEEAYDLPEGVLRSRKLAALLDGIQKSTGTSLPEVLNQYWVAAVLSGMRTQFDTFMSVTNGFGNQLIQSGMLAIKNGNRAAAVVSMMEWWRGLKQAFPEAMQILAKGDYSYLKRFNDDLKKALEGETTFRPVPLGEALWRDGNAMEKYGFAPIMIWTGRLMAAADHLNNSATTAGAKVVARALHPELYQTVAASQSERDAAAAQARREVTGGAMPATAQERATVAARTREILNGQLRPEERAEAAFMGDQAAYQNDPVGVFGAIYRAVNQGLGSLERGLQAYADEKGTDGPAGRYARGLMLFLSGSMRSMMGAKFIRFGANFGNDMLGFVPGTALVSPALLGKEATRSQQQLLMGKNVFGLMAGLTVAAMFLGKDDEEEGWHLEGPWTDLTPEEIKQRRAAGFEPLTFWKRTADKVQRVSYKQWPTAGLLAGVAHMQDRQRFRPEKWAQEGMAGHLLAAASVGAFQVKDVSAMRGLADLLGASKFGTNPEEAFVEKMSKVPVNFAGGFIPTLVKDIDALADPRRYKPATVIEEFLRNVPVLRQRVAGGRPEINILGLPIEQDRKPWSRAYTDAESGAAHAVLGSLSARGFTLPTPETNRKVWKSGAWTTIAALGADAEWRYQKKVGDGYRAWLGSPEGAALLTMPDGLAVQRLINRQAEAIKLRAVAEVVK